MYVKAKKGESLLGQLGHILDETPAQPSASSAPVETNGLAAQPAQAVHEKTGNGECIYSLTERQELDKIQEGCAAVPIVLAEGRRSQISDIQGNRFENQMLPQFRP